MTVREPAPGRLAEVWGDTVDLRHLAWAIAIGIGISLLGLRAGDVARWQTPHGEECSATIESIQYQPEATGDYLT